MITTLSETTQKARKKHWCQDCGQRILKGEKYVRQFLVEDGDTWTFKSHADCFEASWKAFKFIGLQWPDEWKGMIEESADDDDCRDSIAFFLRKHPEYRDVRKRMIISRLSWRHSDRQWNANMKLKRARLKKDKP